jgi:peptide alpha-N-acetyltransferase
LPQVHPLEIQPIPANPFCILPCGTESPEFVEEPPTTYLWSLYFLAQHHSLLSHHDHALSILSTALFHTPTLPELYTCKARVLKRAGDLIGAANCLNEARLLDGQDRFLNTKCAKYCFRAGLVAQGNEVLGLFTKVMIRITLISGFLEH